MKNKKGFTLIEIVISIAIFLILLSIIYPFFLSNYKSYIQSEANLDMQNEGQKAIDSISNIGMQSKKIDSIIDINNTQSKTNSSAVSIKSITFIFYDNSLVKFTLDENILNKIVIQNRTSKEEISKIAHYIDYIEMIPLKDSFETTNSITLQVGLKKGKYEKEFSTNIYFRNSEK